MKIMKKILSLLIAFTFISSNIHIIISAHFSKEGDYSICAVDCEHNEHSSSHDECDLCNQKIRQNFILINNESLINDSNNLFFTYIGIIHSDNLQGLFNTRAPPSYIF